MRLEVQLLPQKIRNLRSLKDVEVSFQVQKSYFDVAEMVEHVDLDDAVCPNKDATTNDCDSVEEGDWGYFRVLVYRVVFFEVRVGCLDFLAHKQNFMKENPVGKLRYLTRNSSTETTRNTFKLGKRLNYSMSATVENIDSKAQPQGPVSCSTSSGVQGEHVRFGSKAEEKDENLSFSRRWKDGEAGFPKG